MMTEIPRRAEERLCMLASRSGEPPLFDKVEVRTGHPSHEIGHAASELGSDLIVMGSLGRSGLVDMLLGSTAERVVVRHAPCPVLVVREPRESKSQTT
jgi:universal stress protein A